MHPKLNSLHESIGRDHTSLIDITGQNSEAIRESLEQYIEGGVLSEDQTLLIESIEANDDLYWQSLQEIISAVEVVEVMTHEESTELQTNEVVNPQRAYNRQREVVEKAAHIAATAIKEVGKEIVNYLHFDGDSRCWSLIPGKEINVAEAEIIAAQALGLFESSALVKDEAQWLLGNVIAVLRDRLGDAFDISKLMEETGRAYNTVMTTEAVFRYYAGIRVPGLTFTHHKEVLYRKNLEPEWKMHILQAAREQKLSTSDCRALAKGYAGRPAEEAEPISPSEAQLTLEQAESPVDNEYVIINAAGSRKIFKGTINDSMLLNSQFIMMIRPRIEVIMGSIETPTTNGST